MQTRPSYNDFLFSVSNDDNFPKPTLYKWKYYIRRYQPDMSRLELLDKGIDPDTMQPLVVMSSPEPKSKPPATVVKSKPATPAPAKSTSPEPKSTPPATPAETNNNDVPATSRKRKGSKLSLKKPSPAKKAAPAKNAAPAKDKKASPQETKVRNILNRASSAPGQGRVSDYFFPSTDTLPDLPDLEGEEKPSAVSSPNVSFFCTCTQAPALSPIKTKTSSFKVTNNGTIVILDTDTE